MSQKKTRQFWKKLIAEYERSSGITQVEFAKANGVKLSTFQRWLYKTRKESVGDLSKEIRFVELFPSKNVVSQSSKTPTVHVPQENNRLYIELPGGMAMEFQHLPTPAYLAAISHNLAKVDHC